MDSDAARKLMELNDAFYARNAAAFSSSRHAPWPGWGKVLDAVDANFLSSVPKFRVLDLAAGNGRFEWFLAGQSARRGWLQKGMRELSCWALDNCDALLAEAAWEKPFRAPADQAVPMSVHPLHWDLRECMVKSVANSLACGAPGECGSDASLQAKAPLEGLLSSSLSGSGAFDLAVCFGFFHHMPGMELRLALLRSLLDQVRPGGLVAISLWRFLDVDGFADEASSGIGEEAIASLDSQDRLGFPARDLFEGLEENDCILGWQKAPGEVRYCHGFTSEEADIMVAAASSQATLVSRFPADGRGSRMNEYLVFLKN